MRSGLRYRSTFHVSSFRCHVLRFAGHGSRVTGHGSLVTGHPSPRPDPSLRSGQAPAAEGISSTSPRPGPHMSLTESQRRVDAWIAQFEEGYFHPLTNMARLSEEVGELAREVNHRFGQKTKKRDEAEGELAMEMADILFVIICMANREGIDLQQAFDRMMAKVESRDADRWTRKPTEDRGPRGVLAISFHGV